MACCSARSGSGTRRSRNASGEMRLRPLVPVAFDRRSFRKPPVRSTRYTKPLSSFPGSAIKTGNSGVTTAFGMLVGNTPIAPLRASILEKTISPGYTANIAPLYGTERSRTDISPSRCTVMGDQSPNEPFTDTVSRRGTTRSRNAVNGWCECRCSAFSVAIQGSRALH